MLKTRLSPKVLILLLIFGSLFTFGIHGMNFRPDGAEPKSYWPGPGERGYEISLEGFSQMTPARLDMYIDGQREALKLSALNGDNRNNRAFAAKKGTKISVRLTRIAKRSDFNHRVGEIRCWIREDTVEVARASTFDPYADTVNCVWVVGSHH